MMPSIADFALKHLRLPEGQRGLFTGGGATIRVSGLNGKRRRIGALRRPCAWIFLPGPMSWAS